MFVVTAEQMRQLDRLTIEKYGVPSLDLMERAGEGVFQVIVERFGRPARKGVLVVAGKGNNGGDGLVVARLLKENGLLCEVALVAREQDLSGDAATNLQAYRKIAGRVTEIGQESLRRLGEAVKGKGLLVDALLGTGLTKPVEGLYADAVELMNASGLPIVSVDVPSGLDSDRGIPLGTTVQAEATVTFAHPKLGQVVYPGASLVGELVVVDIGTSDAALTEVNPSVELLDQSAMGWLLPRRAADSHKGTYGHLLIIAGSRGKTGAAVLACRAAMRVGTGLVTLGSPHGLNDILAGSLLESMTEVLGKPGSEELEPLNTGEWTRLLERKTAVVFGPGIGLKKGASSALQWLLGNLELPWLIDADGLNHLALDVHRLREARTPPILTPHPGEMSRLAGCDTAEVNSDRLGVARRFAREYGCYLVLKGARTVMAMPSGRVYLNPTGNPGMATGGMGDVLSGIVGGLLAQRLAPEEAIKLGVFLHGYVGDQIASVQGGAGMIASDVVEGLPQGIVSLLEARA